MQESLFALWLGAFGSSIIVLIGLIRLAWMHSRDCWKIEKRRENRFWDDYFD